MTRSFTGQTIREGEKVVMWYVSSNRDESRYEDPDRFDVLRNPEHQAFGAGAAGTSAWGPRSRAWSCRSCFEETLRALHPNIRPRGRACIRRESPFINQLKVLPVTLAA